MNAEAMIAEAMIAHHIATKGVTVCPPNIASGGHSHGVCIAPIAEAQCDRFNKTDSAKKGRDAGRMAENAARERLYSDRRRKIVKTYADNPRPETIYAIAAHYGVTSSNVARILREAGIKNVSTTIGRKTGWTHGGKLEQMMAVYDAINSIAEKGEEFPSNPVLISILGMGESTLSLHMRHLKNRGMITVERRGIARIVTIVKMGISSKRPASMMGKSVSD
jgi:DNA-binding transcriptional ArsR family regulator